MRRLTAHYLCPVSEPPIKNGILTLADDGTILGVEGPFETPGESAGLEHYSGILVPGFVNAHCHLELSHLFGKIPREIGLPAFVSRMIAFNGGGEMASQELLRRVDRQMYAKGIVAVGDIANTAQTLEVKKKSPIQYHTFLEVLEQGRGFEKLISDYLHLLHSFREHQQLATLVPHSAYALKQRTLNWLLSHEPGSIVSLHSQESKAEDLLLINKRGPLYEALTAKGIPMVNFQPPGENALRLFSKLLRNYKRKVLFVHNTFAQVGEMVAVQHDLPEATFVTCPKSNLYIENTLPPLDQWHEANLQVAIGTDSLASNTSLDMISEMKTIATRFPHIPFMHLLQWATQNGARALGLEKHLGTFEEGKKPGVNLITGINLRSFQMRDNCAVKRLA